MRAGCLDKDRIFWYSFIYMASYPSGKGVVCKTIMQRFDSARRLNKWDVRKDIFFVFPAPPWPSRGLITYIWGEVFFVAFTCCFSLPIARSKVQLYYHIVVWQFSNIFGELSFYIFFIPFCGWRFRLPDHSWVHFERRIYYQKDFGHWASDVGVSSQACRRIRL